MLSFNSPEIRIRFERVISLYSDAKELDDNYDEIQRHYAFLRLAASESQNNYFNSLFEKNKISDLELEELKFLYGW